MRHFDFADLAHKQPEPLSYVEAPHGWDILDARGERVATAYHVDVARALVAASRLAAMARGPLSALADLDLDAGDLYDLRKDAAKAEEAAEKAEDRAEDIEADLDRARDALRDIRDTTSDEAIRERAEEIVGKSEVPSRPATVDLSALAAKP